MKDFMYQAEKLGAARDSLFLPHPKGEAASIVGAFQECDIAFRNFDVDTVKNDDARRWIDAIRDFMDTSGIEDPTGQGTSIIKAEQMDEGDKSDFVRAVDGLASWFEKAFWEAHKD